MDQEDKKGRLMNKDSSFLQIRFKGYIPGISFIHNLDTRAKIISAIIIMGGAIFLNNLISLFVLLTFVFVLIGFSSIRYSYIFSPIPPLLPFLFIAILFRLFTHTQELDLSQKIIWEWRIFIISYPSLIGSIVLILRFLVLFLLLSLLSATTKLVDFTKGIERITRPFQRVGLPAHEFSMVISIAVNFFHVLINEMNRIIKAQVSRGADFEAKSFNLAKRLRRLMPLIIPLFSFSLEHSKYLVEAMEARCYRGGKGRSYYTVTRYNKLDYLFIAVSLIVTVISIYLDKIIKISNLI